MNENILAFENELMSISDDILSLRADLINAQSIIETSWQGKSGTAADEKVETLKQSLQKADGSITDAANMLR